MIKVDIACECDCCDKILNDTSANIYCHECMAEESNFQVLDTCRYISTEHSDWKDEQFFQGFENDKEKEMYLRGVKYGMHNALFWVCHYFDSEKFFEKEIMPNFKYKLHEENQYVR